MSVENDLKMAKQIATAVDRLGGRTFFVGGYVRDKLIHKENKDIDIEIHNITFNQLQGILESLGKLDERKVGDNFGILALKGYDIDIAMPRSEKPSGEGGHKDFIIDVDPFIGYENACKRRDFSINGLMEDVLTGEILDFYGGLDDIKNGKIKHIDKDTFKDDPLRVYRAAQFASRFGFEIDDDTIDLIKTMDVTKLPNERIAGELDKALLKGVKPSTFFRELKKADKLNDWFPEVNNLIGVKQNPKYHPEGDVFEHTMLVLDQAAKQRDKASNKQGFMLSALCHDFGKPSTTTFDKIKNKITSNAHDTEGVKIANNFIKKIYNNRNLEKYVSNMTELHMKPNMYVDSKAKSKKYMALYDKSVNSNDLILLAQCDASGKGKSVDYSNYRNILNTQLNKYNELIKQPQVNGKDLQQLGYKAGPQFKEMLNYAHKLHLSGVSKENVIKQIQGQFKNDNNCIKQKIYVYLICPTKEEFDTIINKYLDKINNECESIFLHYFNINPPIKFSFNDYKPYLYWENYIYLENNKIDKGLYIEPDNMDFIEKIQDIVYTYIKDFKVIVEIQEIQDNRIKK